MAPEIRAAQVHENVAALAMFGPVRSKLVLEALPSCDRAAIESTGRLDWLPVKIDVALTEAVERIAGHEEMLEWSRVSIRRALATPYLKPFITGAVQLFGMSPSAACRIILKSWSTVLRGCGAIRFAARDARHCDLVWTDAPAEVTSSRAYLEGTAAIFGAVFDVCRVAGDVRVDVDDAGVVTFLVRWRRAADEGGVSPRS